MNTYRRPAFRVLASTSALLAGSGFGAPDHCSSGYVYG
jgi:hypothetical protein